MTFFGTVGKEGEQDCLKAGGKELHLLYSESLICNITGKFLHYYLSLGGGVSYIVAFRMHEICS